MTKNEVDLSVVLKEDYKVKENIEFNGRLNKTSRFILPMLGLHANGKTISKYLKSAFIDDKAIEHDFQSPVFILFRVANQKAKDWQELSKALITTGVCKDAYMMDYYVGDEDGMSLIMFVFDLPSKWAKDYEHFKAGRYSKMSDEYKTKFPKIVYTASGDTKEGREWGILNKSDILKDEVVKKFINPSTSTPENVISLRRDMDTWDEVWDWPNPAEEIYHYAADSITDSTESAVRTEERGYSGTHA